MSIYHEALLVYGMDISETDIERLQNEAQNPGDCFQGFLDMIKELYGNEPIPIEIVRYGYYDDYSSQVLYIKGSFKMTDDCRPLCLDTILLKRDTTLWDAQLAKAIERLKLTVTPKYGWLLIPYSS